MQEDEIVNVIFVETKDSMGNGWAREKPFPSALRSASAVAAGWRIPAAVSCYLML